MKISFTPWRKPEFVRDRPSYILGPDNGFHQDVWPSFILDPNNGFCQGRATIFHAHWIVVFCVFSHTHIFRQGRQKRGTERWRVFPESSHSSFNHECNYNSLLSLESIRICKNFKMISYVCHFALCLYYHHGTPSTAWFRTNFFQTTPAVYRHNFLLHLLNLTRVLWLHSTYFEVSARIWYRLQGASPPLCLSVPKVIL